jgi:hypothetical protein
VALVYRLIADVDEEGNPFPSLPQHGSDAYWSVPATFKASTT